MPSKPEALEQPAAPDCPTEWWVYVLISRPKLNMSYRTYVGSTTDPHRRLRQHNGELKGGAKCTRSHRPWSIGVIYGPYWDRQHACIIEYHVKHRFRGQARLRVPELTPEPTRQPT